MTTVKCGLGPYTNQPLARFETFSFVKHFEQLWKNGFAIVECNCYKEQPV